MPTFNRRRFLQFAGTTLAAYGLSERQLVSHGLRYGQALAQPTTRKLALLVGVNQYPSGNSRFTNLRGCTTDVELQRELLIHRFGFQASDILVLSDDAAHKPTRSNILAAFEEHLIHQAQPGDVVVFHFSGHGSQVLEPNSPDGDGLNSTFVPGDIQENGTDVDDIMGRTLFLLTSALSTDQVSVVLDSCYAGGGTRGNVRVRSGFDGNSYQASAAELAYQSQWLRTLGVDVPTLQNRRNIGVAKGVVIAAAQKDEEAVDVGFDGFYAGAFTYLLTQYLWQQTDSSQGTVVRITRDMKDLSGQVPFLDAPSEQAQSDIYFVPEKKQIPPAEAVVTQVDGDQATVWLGGIDHESITTFGRGAKFTPAGFESLGEVELLSRQGMRGVIKLPSAVPAGTLLQEFSRVVSPELQLRIGIDPSLGLYTSRIQQQLGAIPRVVGVPHQGGNVPYEKEVHYILSRMTAGYKRRFKDKAVPNTDRIGLFSQSLDEWIPGSFGRDTAESATDAVTRLTPKLQSLLAARLIKSLLKANSARLKVDASIIGEVAEVAGEQVELIASAFTPRGESGEAQSGGTHQILLDQDFRFRVVNHEPEPLYISIVIFVTDGRMFVVLPRPQKGREQQIAESRLEGNGTELYAPSLSEKEKPLYGQERGRAEALIIASREPFVEGLAQLQTLATLQALGERSDSESAELSLRAVNTLLGEISSSRSAPLDNTAMTDELPQIQTADIAAFSISVEVV
ncbi:caspase family protein [Adonisia turfae]|uniref:Caspase family protein n=1 Tax=Adonisia turfae CCMR0081 TaxID=2292702 RepID=A0A6M0RU65_9CYAN|nr:caspase family protein [Adonisia turfae]NEZ59251.1 caspase family protein [Adonisia turfae CCMR0081]